MVFLHWLWTLFGVDTRTAEEKELLYVEYIRCMNDIRLYGQVVVYKFSWVDIVGPDSTYFSDLSLSSKKIQALF